MQTPLSRYETPLRGEMYRLICWSLGSGPGVCLFRGAVAELADAQRSGRCALSGRARSTRAGAIGSVAVWPNRKAAKGHSYASPLISTAAEPLYTPLLYR